MLGKAVFDMKKTKLQVYPQFVLAHTLLPFGFKVKCLEWLEILLYATVAYMRLWTQTFSHVFHPRDRQL